MTLPRDHECSKCKQCMELGQKMVWSNDKSDWIHSPKCPPKKYVSSTLAADVAGCASNHRMMRMKMEKRYSKLEVCRTGLR